jgi:polyvinyl alcohol dehydrogenase (cytochrome)
VNARLRTGRCVGAIATAATLMVLAASPGAAGADWPVYGKDLSNSRNGFRDGPSVDQLPTLAQAWSFKSSTGDFTGTPVVAGGVLVAGDYGGMVYALDAVTGKLRWSKQVGDPVNGSAAIDTRVRAGGTVYVPLAHVGGPRLVALSLRDGHLRWSAVLSKQAGSSVYGSPTYWDGSVYIGTSGPNGDASTARGSVVALNATNGALRWRTFTVPPGHDGGAVWSTPAIDTATGRLFVGTGNAYHPPSADTTDAILALDAKTGAILGHFQATSGDTFAPDNPVGPDADFGASPNLIATPSAALVGEGAKDGTYYAVDRATLKLAWKSTTGPGSGAGGIVGSTAYDGTFIFGSNALTSQVWALGRNGSSQWSSADGGILDFSPVATANNLVYSASPLGNLTIRHIVTGTIAKQLSLGAPTFGGISVVGGAVYVAVGVGPPPPPAPQQTGSGSIIAFGDTSRSGASGGGGGGTKAQIRLSVTPRSAVAGRTTVFHFTARTGSGPVAGATIRFAGLETLTNSQGRARLTARLRSGTYKARASKAGFKGGVATVHVRFVDDE